MTSTFCRKKLKVGIKDEQKSKIFEPFYTSQRAKNIGLGLFVVHNIVNEKLKGQIEIIDKHQTGLVFKICWPSNHCTSTNAK